MQAIQEIFARRPRFDVLKTALAQAQFPAARGSAILEAAWGGSDILAKLTDDVRAQLQTAKTLNNVSFPGAKEPFKRLISETPYTVSFKLSGDSLKGICMLALDEASGQVLEARKRLLMTNEAMTLRQNLWLAISRELTSSPATVNGAPRQFSFWDGIPDSLVTSGVGQGLYSEEVAVEVGKCLAEDSRDLQALGDYLTSCRALVNNRDAPVGDRAIEPKTKQLIDGLLEVTALHDLHPGT